MLLVRMKRTSLLTVAVLATVTLLVPAGAFSPTGTDNITDLELRPAEGPNSDYVIINDNRNLELLLTDENSYIDGGGVPDDASTTLANVFLIRNTDTEAATVWVTDDADDIQFYLTDAPGGSIEGSGNSTIIEGGESISVGIRINTRGDSDIGDASSFSINGEPATPGRDGSDADDGATEDDTDPQTLNPMILTPRVQANGTVLTAVMNVSSGQPVIVDINRAGTEGGFYFTQLNIPAPESASTIQIRLNQSASPTDETPTNAQVRTTLAYLNATLRSYSATTDSPGRFSFRVTASQRDRLGAQPEAIQLYRYDGSWKPVETTYQGNGTYTGATPGFSWLAIGVQTPPINLINTTLSSAAVEVGEPVKLNLMLSNEGNADGRVTLDVAVDNETVKTRTPTVAANSTTVKSVELIFNRPGEYNITVNDTAAGAVTVSQSAEAAAPDSTTPEPTTPNATTPTPTTPNPTPPDREAASLLDGGGGSVLVVLLIIIAALGVIVFLRSERRH